MRLVDATGMAYVDCDHCGCGVSIRAARNCEACAYSGRCSLLGLRGKESCKSCCPRWQVVRGEWVQDYSAGLE